MEQAALQSSSSTRRSFGHSQLPREILVTIVFAPSNLTRDLAPDCAILTLNRGQDRFE